MKKRALALVMAVMTAAALTACGSSGSETPATTAAQSESTAAEKAEETTAADSGKSDSSSGSELALVTDLGTIDDKSFNQGAWEGMKKYAEENSISYKYYQQIGRAHV